MPGKIDLSIYIPLFNEEEGVEYLKNELSTVLNNIKSIANFKIILVNDGSTDKTPQLIEKFFSGENYKIIHHEKNKNLGGFLKTALNDCTTEYIGFLDSDCTYHPKLMVEMISKIQDGYEIVNASPYHPNGSVQNVGKVRLFLSRSVNKIYKIISGKNFYTTSSICKIYRTNIVKDIKLTRKNFVGVTELFTKSVLRTEKIYEFPCALNARIYGTSKMNVYENIKDHIKYLFHYLRYKYEK